MAQTETDNERRERVLQTLVKEYRQRHGLSGLAEVIRLPGVPSVRERALRELAQEQAAGN